MKIFLKIVVLVMALGAINFGSVFAEQVKDSPVGKTFYTRVNIWYENPQFIYSTNYHKGSIIPAGTKVTIKNIEVPSSVEFVIDKNPMVFKINRISMYTKVTLKEMVGRYFSPTNILEEDAFTKLTDDEKTNIKKGKIAVGMSKAAVIMAYGYPPTHRTPDLSTDAWTYWRAKISMFCVTFEKDKVVGVGQEEK